MSAAQPLTPPLSCPMPSPPTPCQADIAALLPHNATCTPEGNAAAGGGLAQLLAGAAGDPRRQALLLRSFVMAPCAGGMDALFAGDGMRYSAAGGLLVPQGTEFITSPFQLSPLSSTAVARRPFCAGGGRPGADGRCALP